MVLFVNRNLSKDVVCWKGSVYCYVPALKVDNRIGKAIKANEPIKCSVHCETAFFQPPHNARISIIPESKDSQKDDIFGLFLMDSVYSYGYRMLANPEDPFDLKISYRIFCDSSWVGGKSHKFSCSKFGIYKLGTCIVTQQENGLKYWRLTKSGWKCTLRRPSGYGKYILMDDNLTSIARQLNNELVPEKFIPPFYKIGLDFSI